MSLRDDVDRAMLPSMGSCRNDAHSAEDDEDGGLLLLGDAADTDARNCDTERSSVCSLVARDAASIDAVITGRCVATAAVAAGGAVAVAAGANRS